jgi:hypothetical protein
MNDRIARQLDVQYEQGDHQMWRPIGWRLVSYSAKGELSGLGAHVTEAKVTKCEINLRLDAELFQLDFPVGTWVDDKRTGKEFIVRANERREITKEEGNEATYESLLTTETGMALAPPEARSGRILLIVSSIALFFVLAVIAFRTWKRRTTA